MLVLNMQILRENGVSQIRNTHKCALPFNVKYQKKETNLRESNFWAPEKNAFWVPEKCFICRIPRTIVKNADSYGDCGITS